VYVNESDPEKPASGTYVNTGFDKVPPPNSICV